ncbi:MAG TPA: hypothetical protein VKV03_17635 [Candidatus Binataceae bacterium]|nr:hypothetical protein [Candidatus Binataceae bacterium]
MAESSITETLARLAIQNKWPDDLTRRIAQTGVPAAALNSWNWYSLSAEQAAAQLGWYERLTTGDLRGRDATFADNDAYSALWADAPEEVAGWEITVERGPDAFAQFRLQENVHLPVLALGPELIACCAFSRRNTMIAGRRVSVRYGQALRVRRAYRRAGYGDQVRRLAGPPAQGRPELAQYDLMRTQNFAVVNWWQKFVPGFFDNTPKRDGAVPGIPVAVAQFPAQPSDADPSIRLARPEDLPACAALINRTHDGRDLFRPSSAEYLESVLDEGYWGVRPGSGNPAIDWWKSIYAWSDYFVLEEGGRIRACGGLWDRGRDVRERWKKLGGHEERCVSVASILDYGYEAGAAECMTRLMRHFVGRAHQLGRDYLAAPIQHLPELVALTESMRPEQDERSLRWDLNDPAITKPYIDLRYW